MSTSKGTFSVPKYSFTTKMYFITVMVKPYIYIHTHIYMKGNFFLSIYYFKDKQET